LGWLKESLNKWLKAEEEKTSADGKTSYKTDVILHYIDEIQEQIDDLENKNT